MIVAMLMATALVVSVHSPESLSAGLCALTGAKDAPSAWGQFAGSNDIVGIKVNAQAAPLHGTHPAVVDAIVSGLRAAGVAATNIVAFDRDAQKLAALGLAGTGVRDWDEALFYENKVVGRLIWGDLLFGGPATELSTRSHLPKLLTQRLTKLINVPVLQDHEAVGLSGCLQNLSLGLVDNARRFETRGETALAEICALPVLRTKTVLHVLDGLVGGYAGGPAFKARYSWPYGRLLLSTDPVAVDTLALELIEAKRREAQIEEIGPRAAHIGAAARLGLGVNDRKAMRLVEIP